MTDSVFAVGNTGGAAGRTKPRPKKDFLMFIFKRLYHINATYPRLWSSLFPLISGRFFWLRLHLIERISDQPL